MASTLVMLDVRLGYGCNVIGSWMIPVLSPDMFDIGGIGNFYLTWNSTSCKACEYEMYRFDGDGSKDNLWKKFAGSPFFVPSFVAMAIFFVIFLLQITKYIAGRNGMNSNSPAVDALPESTTAPPQSTAGGLDESKISSCTELVVLSGIRRNPGADCNICSICLESYSPREILRSIAKCEHYFHADCIELWLSKNSTCPLCRTVLADLISDGYKPIRCLSNYPNVTVASSSELPGNMIRAFNCSEIVTAKIPVENFGQFESYSIISNLILTWDFPSCEDCEEQFPEETVATFGTFFGLSCFVFLNKMIAARNQAHTTMPEVALMPETTMTDAVSPPQSTGDYSNMKTYIVSEFLEEINIGTSGLNQGRLMNLSLSTSPFVAVAYQNYTFFSCKHESLILRNYSVIDCLSNSTTYVLATSLQSRRNEIMKLKGCNVIVNMKIAVSSLDQYENNGFEGDLQLAWNDQNCYGDCKGKSQSISVVSIILLCCITIAIAILCTLFCTGCCLRFTGFILEYKDANNRRLHRSTRVLQMTRINLPLAQPQPLSSPPRSNFLTVNDPWMSFSPGEPSVTTTPSLETRITLFLAQPEPIPSPPRPPNDTSWMSFSPEAPSVTTTPNREEFSSTEVLIIGGKECISGPNSDSCSICLQDYTASERLRLHASNDCPTSYCEGDSISIEFPFSLQDQQPQNCGSPGFNLTCPGHNKTALYIPNSGEFYVRSIYYYIRRVSLYDPHNCLPRRLLSLNLSSSPFKVISYQNYTFLRCPKGQVSSSVINCLSNSTTDILATKYQSDVTRFSTCKKIGTLTVPVSTFYDYGYGFPDELELTWDFHTCKDCRSAETGEAKTRPVSIIMTLSIIIPVLVVLIVGTSCCIWIRIDSHHTSRASDRDALSNTITTGLDKLTIETYKKITISESRCITGPNDVTCAICLADYEPKETIRLMPECEHCFHVECIDTWLSMNSMCPICRTLQPRIDSC
ncbi:hypothetical protein BUALT_Bualt01G0239100 [Buddleja alternifolia]|uniref:RING-type E3 ubiquitin transferase n=1 Tax=Buddleja alternifolia TaxID=168488 RepID=A0AAV6YGH8_9LAMI|nr:hypothetical protein BUALT_Bualt01G0239100 [Buddleja alternifolia]